jgi:hemerythrin-like domain-containing protein
MKNQNILSLIRSQHEVLRKAIKVLKNENIIGSAKIPHLKKFIGILKMHSEAEEKTVYNVLRDIENDEMIVLEALEEHGLAKELIADLEAMDYENNWDNEVTAKAKVLAEIVEHHAKEEEEEIFAAARQNFTSLELEALGEEFQRICDEFRPERDVTPTPSREREVENESFI